MTPLLWPEAKPCLVLPVLEFWKGVWQKRVCYLHSHHDDFLCLALYNKEIRLSPKKAFGLISLVLLAEIIYYDASWSPVSKALSYFLSFNSLNTVKYPADVIRQKGLKISAVTTRMLVIDFKLEKNDCCDVPY